MVRREAPIRLRPTRLGWQFGFIGIFAMLGGAIRSYNLPLVLAGLIVAALILQWRWGRQTILAVTLQRRLPDEAFAGQSFPVRFLVTNHSRWLPAWLLQIDDSIRAQEGSSLGEPRRIAKAMSSPLIHANCGLGVVPAASALTAQYDCAITRRGRYDFGPVKLATGSPLGLMIADRIDHDSDSLYVFPRLLALKRQWRQILQSRPGGNATNAMRSGMQEGEFFGIRSWQAGDSRRWIHWRTTARMGEPAVRQFEQQRRFEFCVLVDAYLPTIGAKGRGVAAGGNQTADDDALEWVISTAATLVTTLIATPTNKIGLVLAGQQITALTSGGGREQTIAMMRHLAELVGSPKPDLCAAVRQMIRTSGRPQDLLILSPRRVIDDAQELVSLIARRSAMRWCSVADGSIAQLVERFPGGAAIVESHRTPYVPSDAGGGSRVIAEDRSIPGV